jgi:RimJ/RimL family protein N-acetyltransferase
LESILNINFTRLIEPTPEIAAAYTKWENDSALIHLTRPNPNEAALLRREVVSLADLLKRLEHHHIYLIYLDAQLIGEMSYQIDPPYLYKKETGTAWIGITIGEEVGRGKGIGYQALQYLEEEIKSHGLKRIELGVFEFNTNAIKLYHKLGYQEIARIDNFTYWQGKMWQDIRMEKYLSL